MPFGSCLWLYFFSTMSLSQWHCNCFMRGRKEKASGPEGIAIDTGWSNWEKGSQAKSVTKGDLSLNTLCRIMSSFLSLCYPSSFCTFPGMCSSLFLSSDFSCSPNSNYPSSLTPLYRLSCPSGKKEVNLKQ